MKLNFVSLIFDDPTEINLLKLQALSFKYIEPDLINNIYIVYNENKRNFFISQIINYYPSYLENKIK